MGEIALNREHPAVFAKGIDKRGIGAINPRQRRRWLGIQRGVVINVDYYATLDTQPPSALAGIYRADATLIDPFGEHSGVFAIQRYFTHLLAN